MEETVFYSNELFVSVDVSDARCMSALLQWQEVLELVRGSFQLPKLPQLGPPQATIPLGVFKVCTSFT